MSKPKQIKVTFIGNSYSVKAKAKKGKKLDTAMQAKVDAAADADACPFC